MSLRAHGGMPSTDVVLVSDLSVGAYARGAACAVLRERMMVPGVGLAGPEPFAAEYQPGPYYLPMRALGHVRYWHRVSV